MKITNKDVIQSYILTIARYDFSVHEKRILYKLVEAMQPLLLGEELNHKIKIKEDLFGHHVTMPIACFLTGEDDRHHERVKDALRSLESKKFEYEDDKIWTIIRLIHRPIFTKNDSYCTFWLNPMIYEALLNFSKGYRKLELKTAFTFESAYAMRFYELFSGQKTPITYTIDNLRLMFQVQNNYSKNNDFMRFVVEMGKKELDEKSPYSFTYKVNKVGNKMHSLTFYPLYKPENRDPVLERKELQKKVSVGWSLNMLTINYLKENFGFNDAEIQNNIDILKIASEKLDLLYDLSLLRTKTEKVRSPQAYVIGVLKKKIAAIK